MESEQVRRLRSFNRTVTQHIGALSDRFLNRERSLGEARFLYEVGPDGADVRELRARLDLDSGYASRLLRSLEGQGLVKTQPSANDARVVRVELTRKGHREVMELDRRSNEFAESVLASLSSRQRERLISAMSEVERLIRASAIRLAVEPPDSIDARACLKAYFQELNERFDAGCEPTQTLSASPQEMSPPSGVFVIARLAGRPIGCGGLKVKGTDGDVKRMWVRPDARGLGVGRRILETLETHAREFGVGTIRLETNRNLNEAQALYRAAGYQEVAPFNEEPYAHHWFAKLLTTGPSSTSQREKRK